MKLYVGGFHENPSYEIQIWLKSGKISRNILEDLHANVAGDIKSPLKRCLRVKWYRALRIAEGHKRYANAPQRYVISALPVL
jgi:hypothetical protein